MCAIYLRISLDPTGEMLAIQRQQEDAIELAATRGWNVYDTYIDNSVSASRNNVLRPEYTRMVGDYKSGKFNAIICYDLDRLTRKPRELEDWIDAAESKKLIIITMNGEADLSTDAGKLFARLKVAVAKSESERKSARQKRAARQRAELGKPPLGVRLTGYDVTGNIVEGEAELVRNIFRDFYNGVSLYAIARTLSESGALTRTGRTRWSPSSLRAILVNPRYCGRAIYQGAPTGGMGNWQPLIAEDLFDAVNRKLNDPRRISNREGTARKHIGSGLYECHQCGKPIVSNGDRYYCRTCGMSRSRRLIDEAILHLVADRLSEGDVARLLAPRANPEEDALREEAIRNLQTRLTNIEADYDNGIIDGRRFASARDKVEAELQPLLEARAAAVGNTALSDMLATVDPAAQFLNSNLDTQRSIIRALMRVALKPSDQGRKGLARDSVQVIWHKARVDTNQTDAGGLPRFLGGAVPDEIRNLLR